MPDVAVTQRDLRAVRLFVPQDTHEQMRLLAARLDISLANLARLAVEELVARKGSPSKRQTKGAE